MELVPVTEVPVTIVFLHLGPVYVWPRTAMVVMVVLEYKKPGMFALPAATLLFLVDVLGSIKLLPITDVLIRAGDLYGSGSCFYLARNCHAYHVRCFGGEERKEEEGRGE